MMPTITFNANHLAYILNGAAWTVMLSLISFVTGGAVGFVIALARISPSRIVRWLSAAYVQLVQGTPLIVLMFLSYFGLAILGADVPPLVAVTLAMTVYVSAYIGEIWRGCLESVPRQQWESAESLALTRFQRMRLVILPQAVRIATPPTAGFMVQVVKNTSLASVVGFVELVRAGQLVNNWIFAPLLVYALISVLYFAMCYPLSKWSRRLEERLLVGRVQASK